MWSNVEVCSQMGASLAGAGSQKSSAVAYSCHGSRGFLRGFSKGMQARARCNPQSPLRIYI